MEPSLPHGAFYRDTRVVSRLTLLVDDAPVEPLSSISPHPYRVVMGNAWSAVVVAVLWGVVALVLALTGKKQIEEVAGVPQTVETVKEIPETLKRNEENR